jgi:2-amino-4-hydroxy-6-hydroxymethyldihydropteridine diphosphokinase
VNKVYLGLGSNLGDRSASLAEAIRQLNDSPHVEVTCVSSVYETAPVGVSDQPQFLNLVAAASTTLTPHELLDRCLEIEQSLGRIRRERWGPRTIDIDLLIHGDMTIADDRLTLPHPRMVERSFVIIPMAEIAPDLEIAGSPAHELAKRLGNAGVKKIGPLKW